MSKGMGRTERWLINWLDSRQGGDHYWSFFIGEQYAAETGQNVDSARASIRRAARTLEKRGLVTLQSSVYIDSFYMRGIRARRTMSIGRPLKEGEEPPKPDGIEPGTPEWEAMIEKINSLR